MRLKLDQIQPLVSMVTDRVKMEKQCLHFFSAVFHPFLFILAGNDECMRARMSSNFSLIGPPTAELDALERLKKIPKGL